MDNPSITVTRRRFEQLIEKAVMNSDLEPKEIEAVVKVAKTAGIVAIGSYSDGCPAMAAGLYGPKLGDMPDRVREFAYEWDDVVAEEPEYVKAAESGAELPCFVRVVG